MVLINGRVDQKGEGETKLVAQGIRAFTPEEGGEDERLLVKVNMARLAATPLDELRRLLSDHKGPAQVVMDVQTDAGRRAPAPGRGVHGGPARQQPGRGAEDPLRGALPGLSAAAGPGPP